MKSKDTQIAGTNPQGSRKREETKQTETQQVLGLRGIDFTTFQSSRRNAKRSFNLKETTKTQIHGKRSTQGVKHARRLSQSSRRLSQSSRDRKHSHIGRYMCVHKFDLSECYERGILLYSRIIYIHELKCKKNYISTTICM